MNGVYKICNKVNGKIYVGSSSNIKVRWAKHKALLRHHYHPNSHLQAAWDKYGEENFEFSLIESCPVEKLLIREQFFIDTLKPEYNQTAIAGKIEMTTSRRKKLSEATRNAYLSGRLIKTAKEVYQYDLKGNYMNHFNSLTEASKMTNTDLTNLSNALNGRANIAGGYVWRFYKTDKLDVWFNKSGRKITKEPYIPKHISIIVSNNTETLIFKNAKDASLALGCTTKQIYNAIRRNSLLLKKYKVSRERYKYVKSIDFS